MTYDFTDDWFSHNIPTWQAVLPQRNIAQALEVGSHEGRSAVWLTENVLNSKQGWQKLICIDIWEDKEIYSRFRNNTRMYEDKIRALRGNSIKTLTVLGYYHEKFDFIYVDGS